MVKLPDTRQIQRNQPQYTGQVFNVPVSQDAQGVAEIAGSVSRMAIAGQDYINRQAEIDARRQKAEQDAMQARQAEVDKFILFKAKAEADNNIKLSIANLKQDPDYNSIPKKFDESFKTTKDNIFASLPDNIKNDPIARGYIETDLQKKYTDAQVKLRNIQYKKQEDTVKASLFEMGNQYTQNYALLGADEIKEANKNLDLQVMSAVNAGVITKEQGAKYLFETKTNAERNRIEALPDEQVLSEYGGSDNKLVKMAKILSLESGGRNLQNPQSSAGGYLQWTDATAKQYGVTKGDLQSELKAKEKFDADNAKQFKKVVGRNPSDWEEYMLHQQGSGGGSAIIANPEKNIADVLAPYYDTRENLLDAINNNGGNINMTAGEFANIWRKKYNEADISNLPQDVVQQLQASFGGKNTVLPISELAKRLNDAKKNLAQQQQKQNIDDVVSTVSTRFKNDYASQVETVNLLNLDTETKQKTLKILAFNNTQAEKIKKQESEKISLSAIDFINSGKLYEDIPPKELLKLTPSDRDFLRKHSDKKNNVEQKERVKERMSFANYQQMYYDDPNSLKDISVAELAGNLSDAHFNKVMGWRGTIDKPSETGREERNEIVRNSHVLIGIPRTPTSDDDRLKASQFREAIDNSIDNFEIENNRKPNYKELVEIRDRLVKENVVKKGLIWDTKVMNFEINQENVKDAVAPPEEADKIIAILQAKNPKKYYSPEFINEIYRKELLKNAK